MRIAILAFQGAFAEHQQMLQRLGVETFLVRKPADWVLPKDGLIIPGGESTSMLRIMSDEGLLVPIREAIENGLPVFGTCAGMILLAASVSNDNRQRLATMDIVVRRNAYGRQLGSFFIEDTFKGIGTIPMTFIRAPYIESVGSGVEVLATHEGHITAARQGNQLVCSFHPELNDNLGVHDYFVKMINGVL